MGAKYTTQSASGYNSSPPPDDGSQSASNLITWDKHKTKLGDPVKNLADSINTALVSAFDYSVRQITSSDSTVAGDHMRVVEIAPTVTTGITVSLGDAATMTNVYRVFVKNSSAIAQTLGRVTSGDTIDGIAANRIIPSGEGILLGTNSAATGYHVLSRKSPYSHGADVASASTINLDSATGDLVDVTGTTTITAITLSDGGFATVRFTGILTLTNGASLILPGATSIVTAAGDIAMFRGYASGVVRCVNYQRASVIPDHSLILLTSGAASNSSSVDIVGLISTYDEYLITVSDLTLATDNTQLLLRFSEDGGSTFKAGATDYAHTRLIGVDASLVFADSGSTGDTAIVLVAGNSNTKACHGRVWISVPAGTSRHKLVSFDFENEASGNTIQRVSGGGVFKLDTNAVNAVRFLSSSGNITNGNFAVYGVRKT